ncbi:hypothetical protein FE392_04680 [Xenorhabdus sp. 12]|uniref:Fimbrial protein n=1 Tax=Xenorhabdus santafensis TaxID=2582833 RepID=A0ABU4S5Z0_9GAMM|nr:hypothetical protein [Xenorhabdus sp. 12]MDX7986632.1 hypothetical protein [Xenorhabdus sp. 12]
MSKFNFIFVFCFFIIGCEYVYCQEGDWVYYLESGNTNSNANASYTGVMSRNGLLELKVKLPTKVTGTVGIVNENAYANSSYTNNLTYLNLLNKINFSINGSMFNADLEFSDEYKEMLTHTYNYFIYDKLNGFISIWSENDRYEFKRLENNKIYSFDNKIKTEMVLYYKLNEDIPHGSYNGSVNIGKFGVYGERSKQFYVESYGLNINYGANLNLNYIINITNSCTSKLPNEVVLKHEDLTTTNFSGKIKKLPLYIQCDSPVPVNFYLYDNKNKNNFGKLDDGKIKLTIPTNIRSVESSLVLEGNEPMSKGKGNEVRINVGSGGEILTLSSKLIKTSDDVIPGNYSAKATLEVWID